MKGRLRGSGAVRRIGAISYARILAQDGVGCVAPVIPYEEPDVSEADVPAEMRGALWTFLSWPDRVALVARLKGWRVRASSPELDVMLRLRARADAGEFRTLPELEAAYALEMSQLEKVAAVA